MQPDPSSVAPLLVAEQAANAAARRLVLAKALEETDPLQEIHYNIRQAAMEIPRLRQYAVALLHSDQQFDRMRGLFLALCDQGMAHPYDLLAHTVAEVKLSGNELRIAGRRCALDPITYRAAKQLMGDEERNPEDPFFAYVDGDYVQPLGNHQADAIFRNIGITVDGLRSYHATQLFSQEFHRIIEEDESALASDAAEQAFKFAQTLVGKDAAVDPSLVEVAVVNLFDIRRKNPHAPPPQKPLKIAPSDPEAQQQITSAHEQIDQQAAVPQPPSPEEEQAAVQQEQQQQQQPEKKSEKDDQEKKPSNASEKESSSTKSR